MLGLCGLLALIIVPVGVLNGAPPAVFAVLALSLGVFVAMGAYAFVRHRGGVVLLSESVGVVRGGRVEEQLRYEELTGIRFFDRHIPPNVTLYGPNGTLRFSGQIENAPRFFEGLFERAPALLSTRRVKLPLRLDARQAIRREFIGAATVLGILFYGILAWSLWMHGPAQLVQGLVAMTLIWLFFVAVVGLIAIRPGEAIRVHIGSPEEVLPVVRAWTFFGRETALPFAQLASVRIVDRSTEVGDVGLTVKKQSFPIRFKARAEEGSGSPSKRSVAIYADEVLCRSIGETPMSLLAALKSGFGEALPVRDFEPPP